MATFWKQLLRWLRPDPERQGVAIPPDARVDPAGFPEDEFPLHCPTCDYLLRGLPEDRCPECGRGFDRGRLLVEQFVISRGPYRWPWLAKHGNRLLVIGTLLSICPVLLAWGFARFAGAWVLRGTVSLNQYVEIGKWCTMILFCVGWLMIVVGLILLRRQRSLHENAKRVFAALDRGSPTFRAARRRSRVFWAVWMLLWLLLMVYLTIQEGTNGLSQAYRYYKNSPVLMLAPFFLSWVCGVLIYVVSRLTSVWKRSEDQ